jgi:dihydrofolate reductase
MPDKKIKYPEIAMIVAMTESGLVGRGGGLPWSCSLDFKWFQKHTTGWPMIFGQNTANGMPTFPLKNRPCAVVSNKVDTGISPAMFDRGAYLEFGPGPFYDSVGEALRFFKNFDKIFIAGGPTLYKHAMNTTQPWMELMGTPEQEKPLVDTIIKTTFPDGYAEGDVYFKNKFMDNLESQDFELVEFYDFQRNDTLAAYLIKDHDCYAPASIGDMGFTRYDYKDTDTPFPWIKFEIWKRQK